MSNREPSDIIHFHYLNDHKRMQKQNLDADALIKSFTGDKDIKYTTGVLNARMS